MSIALAMTMVTIAPATLAAAPQDAPVDIGTLAVTPAPRTPDSNRPELAGSTVPETYLKAPNAEAGATFGAAIAISGDTMVVGASREDGSITSTVASPNNFTDGAGAAYVYVRSGTDWVLQQYLKSPLANTYNAFGGSVAIDGDTLVVGEPYALNSYGAAHVFTRSGGVWTEQQILTPTNPGYLDGFGIAVTIDGDTVAVGAYQEDGSAASSTASPDELKSDSGAAYVFTRSGSVWTQQAYLKASNADPTDYFGSSVDVFGDTVVIGAIYEDGSITSTMASPNTATIFSGAGYVFTRTGGVWAQQAYLKAPNPKALGQFGYSVAVDHDTIIIGEPTNSFGNAYAFVRNGDIWTLQATLQDTIHGSSLGFSVALDGDLAVIGDRTDGYWSNGSVRVFFRNGIIWTQQAYLTASNTSNNDYLGAAVAIDGLTVVAGAEQEDGSVTSTLESPNELADFAGAAYVFQGPGSTQMSLVNATLTPAFVSTTQAYTAEVPTYFGNIAIATSIGWQSVLTATAAMPCDSSRGPRASTPQILTNCPLEFGPNVITITVSDGSGAEQSYELTITRMRSSNAWLNNLVLSAGELTPSFSSCLPPDRPHKPIENRSVTAACSLTASVPYAVNSMIVTATTSDANASYVVSNSAGVCAANTCALAVGDNTLTVTVTAQDGTTTKDYVVVVTRTAAPTPTPPTPTPAPTATPETFDAFVSPKNGAVTTATVSIISPRDGGFRNAKQVSVNGVKMFHVVRNDKRIDFTMRPGVAGTTVDVVLIKADDTVMTFTQSYTFEGPTRAFGNISAGAILTTASGVTITVPRQAAARPAAPDIAGSLVITYVTVEFPANPPGDVPLSFFEVSMDVDGVGVSTLTNPATLELPVDTAKLPTGQIARLYEWVAASRWSPVPGQSYDPAAGIVTAPIQRLGNYVLMSAPASQWWFPLVTLE